MNEPQWCVAVAIDVVVEWIHRENILWGHHWLNFSIEGKHVVVLFLRASEECCVAP